MTVHDRPWWCRDPAQNPVSDGDGPRYTYMNETRNETNRPPGTCGESQPEQPSPSALEAGSRINAAGTVRASG
jgi:hypothetical protein